MYEKMELEKELSAEIQPHYYLINGLGKFDNMKDLRMTLKVSRQAIRMLMRVGVIKRVNRETIANSYLRMSKENGERN
jgi:hypothetical protein